MPSGHVDGATGRRLNRRVWTTGSEPGNLGVMFRSLCEPKSQRKREKETLGHCHLRAVEKIMSRRLEKQARLECWRLVSRNPSKSHRVLHAEGGSRAPVKLHVSGTEMIPLNLKTPDAGQKKKKKKKVGGPGGGRGDYPITQACERNPSILESGRVGFELWILISSVILGKLPFLSLRFLKCRIWIIPPSTQSSNIK